MANLWELDRYNLLMNLKLTLLEKFFDVKLSCSLDNFYGRVE